MSSNIIHRTDQIRSLYRSHRSLSRICITCTDFHGADLRQGPNDLYVHVSSNNSDLKVVVVLLCVRPGL